jgi:Cdc6-like AAA superfamily ATPase
MSILGAVLTQSIEDIFDYPDRLIGRDEKLAQINKYLSDNQKVLLQGYSGVGKTAIAATVAVHYLEEAKGLVLWLQVGNNNANAVLEALTEVLLRHLQDDSLKSARQLQGATKLQFVRQLLEKAKVALLVFDDASSGEALNLIVKAIPKSTSIIVTSRNRYPTFKIVEIDDLSQPYALELLGYYAGKSYGDDSDAKAL